MTQVWDPPKKAMRGILRTSDGMVYGITFRSHDPLFPVTPESLRARRLDLGFSEEDLHQGLMSTLGRPWSPDHDGTAVKAWEEGTEPLPIWLPLALCILEAGA
jgi:hypothetical protein